MYCAVFNTFYKILFINCIFYKLAFFGCSNLIYDFILVCFFIVMFKKIYLSFNLNPVVSVSPATSHPF